MNRPPSMTFKQNKSATDNDFTFSSLHLNLSSYVLTDSVVLGVLMSMEPWVPPAPVLVPSQRPLVPSLASITSVATDKGDNEMILGAVHRSPGIRLTAEENPRKPQLGDRLMKGLCDQSSPQMGSLSSK